MTPQTTQDTPTEANDGIQVSKLYWKSCLLFTFRLFSHHIYWIALAPPPARQLYRIGLLFTHKNGDFGANSVTERNCTAPISKLESRLSYLMFILYRRAFAPARKPHRHRIGLLFTQKKGDFGAVSVTERSCAALNSKAASHISAVR